jgi:uncharacterized Zn finger protein
MGRPRNDRIKEYVDSGRMRQRLKVGNQISCLIDGNYGAYRTQVTLKKRLDSSCSCPSDYYPCKHVDALLETYKINPRSFLDYDAMMKNKLAKMEKYELVQLIRQMVLASPPSLSAMGLNGFEEAEDGDEAQ